MVDLAYAAVYFGDPQMAEEVDELEDRLNELVHDMLFVSRRLPGNRRRPQKLLDHAARGADPFCQLDQFGLLGWRIESTEFAIRHIGIATLTIKPVVGELRCKRIHGGSR